MKSEASRKKIVVFGLSAFMGFFFATLLIFSIMLTFSKGAIVESFISLMPEKIVAKV